MNQYFDVTIPKIIKDIINKMLIRLKKLKNILLENQNIKKYGLDYKIYLDDNNPWKLSLNEITRDSLTGINGNSDGVM